MREHTELFEPTKKSINIVIVALTVIAFFVMQFWEKNSTDGVFYGHTTQFLLEHGALYAPGVRNGEWYRLVTHLFLHGDIMHLGNNMLILFCLGNALEHYLGKFSYAGIYFFSGILAGLGSVVYNTDNTVSVGASGAVFGVVGAMAWLVVRNKGRLPGFTGPRMLIFVLMSVYAGFADRGVDNAAHIAGLIAGFLLAILIYRKPEAETEVVP
ncbi:MAG: rhomboid family intramembrane serine protease [Lachnospiraceae bacterium]|nr:rhomboid family intramembrane serine protease [Lachnospiraceae bacterium]MBP3577904.1 rhomboid family intramembrane serine protease [Lachnospiraceae bacterium]